MIEIDERNPQERADLTRYRAGLYRLASSVFLRELSDDELDNLIRTAREALASEAGWVLACERELLEKVAQYDERAEDGLGTRIRTEYAELFVGPRPPLAPLYESLYRGQPRRLYTDVTRGVRDAYERAGLTVERRNKIPDDHVGYELGFMARLCEQQACALDEGAFDAAAACAGVQQEFLSEQLAQWMPLFSERVGQAECSDFYRAWAQFVAAFVAEDAALLCACEGEWS